MERNRTGFSDISSKNKNKIKIHQIFHAVLPIHSYNAWTSPVTPVAPSAAPVCAAAPPPAPVSAAPRAARSTPGASEVGPAASALDVGGWMKHDRIYIRIRYHDDYCYHHI